MGDVVGLQVQPAARSCFPALEGCQESQWGARRGASGRQ